MINKSDITFQQNKGEFVISIRTLPYLADHAFQGMIVLPGSAYIEMTLIIYSQFFNKTPGVIKDIYFDNIVLLSEKETKLAFEIKRDFNDELKIKFSDITDSEEGRDSSITHLSAKSGEIKTGIKYCHIDPEEFKKKAANNIQSDDFYRKLSENGNQYGPGFQKIKEIWIYGNKAIGKLFDSSNEINNTAGDHFLHPSLLDSFTQLLSSLSDSKGRTFVLNSIDEIEIFDLQLTEEIWCEAEITSNENGNGFEGNLKVFDTSGKIYLELKCLRFKYLEKLNREQDIKDEKEDICIASTFTADPIEDSLKFWSNYFKVQYRITFAPYNQVFQELLDPNSLFYKNKKGINIILLGLEDWAKQENFLSPKIDTEKIEELFKDKSRYILPNKAEIVHLNKYETEYVYNEIFVDKVYLKHGITINEGDTVIDIGANIGLFTLFINQHCRNTEVYSFEPSPVVYELLKANSEIYGSQVKTFNYGVSDKRKTAQFTFYRNSSVFSSFNANEDEDKEAIQAVVRNMFNEMGSLERVETEEYVKEITNERLNSQTYECKLLSVSDIIEENKIEKIDLLKIDAEKSELDIIKGIKESDWDKIRQIVIEIHDKIGNIFEEIKSILTLKGFYFEVEEEKFLKKSGLYNIYCKKTSYESNSNSVSSLAKSKRKKLNENLENFSQAFRSFMNKSKAPMIVGVCERSPEVLSNAELKEMFDEMENKLFLDISNISNVYFLKSRSFAEKYYVKDYYDRHGNELGHIPYTNEYFTSLGTLLFRNILSIKNAGHKVIALDCDNTLWKGVCGEDGVSGIMISGGYKELQKFMAAQISAGMIVCICSKNNEEDVFEIFDKREDMILKRENLVSWRINWNLKSENLKALARELNLGLDSFIFLDDDPVECNEVNVNCPEVMTLQIPKDEGHIKRFLDNVWIFDHVRLTEEDKKRTQMYKENVQREKYREDALSLKDFLDGLKLNIKISNPATEQNSRVSQLTFRTNQFNFTTIRRTETEVNNFLDNNQNHCLITEVSDRFGDYGLTGVLFYSIAEKTLKVDTFLLSCRVLGRGIEYRILSELGKIALENNMDFIQIKYIPSLKNRPALDFIEKIGTNFKTEISDGLLYLFPAEYLTNLSYSLSSSIQETIDEIENENEIDNKSINKRMKSSNLSDQMQRIAENFNSNSLIYKAVETFKVSKLEPDSSNFLQPNTDREKQISLIWQKVLGRTRVGLNDNFFEIGGTSLKAVQLIALIKKELGINLSIVKLFECPTVGLLSKRLIENEASEIAGASEEIAERGRRRRENQITRKR